MRRTRRALVAACAVSLIVVPSASAHGSKPSPRDRAAKQFVRDVSVKRIVKHQAALQRIARRNGDTREVLSGGYTESLAYVKKTLRRAGYSPKEIEFNFPFWVETAPPVLQRVTPTARTYTPGTAEDDGSPDVDFITMTYSPTKTLTGVQVVPTNDIVIPPPGGAGIVDQRLRGRRLPERHRGQGRTRHARHVRVRGEGRRGADGRRRGRDHLQRRRRRHAPGPDLR